MYPFLFFSVSFLHPSASLPPSVLLFLVLFFISSSLRLRSEAPERGSGRGFDAAAAGSGAGERRAEKTTGGAAGPAGGQSSEVASCD